MKKVLFEKRTSEAIVYIQKRDKKLYRQVIKQLEIFQNNPLHPSLKLHKLKGKLGRYWSISVNRSLRLVYIENEDAYVFVDFGTHDEVYKK